MKTLGSFVRIPAVVAMASGLLISDVAQAALPISSSGTGNPVSATVWICLAVFVLGTLGLAFWNSKRSETQE